MTDSGDLYGMELECRLAAERALAAVLEVVDTYESCGPKRQCTRDALAAVRAACGGQESDSAPVVERILADRLAAQQDELTQQQPFRRAKQLAELLAAERARTNEAQHNALEMARKSDAAERRAEEAEYHVEQLRDALERAERRIERAERLIDSDLIDRCPLSKASCNPLANGCDGECETEWRSFACTGSNHAACDGIAWQPDIECECECHSEASAPPAGGVS